MVEFKQENPDKHDKKREEARQSSFLRTFPTLSSAITKSSRMSC